MSSTATRDKFLAMLEGALADGSFVKLTLSGYRGKDRSLKQLLVRSIELQQQPVLSLVWRQANRDVTRNLSREEGLALLGEVLGTDFCMANLFTTRLSAQLEFRDGRGARLTERAPAHQAAPSKAHDAVTSRRLTTAGSPWLRGLGVATPEGKVAKGMEAKFRQVNKFLEVLDPLLAQAELRLPGASISAVDMGCGKGYLTFAAYDWWQRSGARPEIRGLEVRPELVEAANRLARENNFAGLRFETSTIADTTLERVDVLVALHACDTATDDALAKGIGAGARLIVVSPCCHKEVRPQLQPPPVLAGALRHGILRERQAEFVTDALRAALLEWAGYDTSVFEFVSTEHTAKNLMIAAVKRPQPPGATEQADAAQRIRDLAGYYGVRGQRLAQHLGLPLAT